MTPEEHITHLHREVFLRSASGQELLAYLLGDMGVFDEDVTEAGEVAVANYGRRMLTNLGLVNTKDTDKRTQQLNDIVRELANIPYEGDKDAEGMSREKEEA